MSELNERYEKEDYKERYSRLAFEEAETKRQAGLQVFTLPPAPESMATIEEEFQTFKFLYENNLTMSGLQAVSWSLNQASLNQRHNPLIRKYIVERLEQSLKEPENEEEIGMCPKCREWTSVADPCCGVEPVESYDRDDVER